MPWEVDYALLSFMQLNRAKYHLSEQDTVFVDVTLNLSSYIIDWEKSILPKTFFKEKFKQLQNLLEGYTCRFFIYEGDSLYGALDSQKISSEDHIDHYILMNPDIHFNEKSLSYLIEGSKVITTKYAVITQEIPKLWDSSWDEISNKNFVHTPYKDWNKLSIYECDYVMNQQEKNVTLAPVSTFKWAGWMDLYSKDMWKDFWIFQEEWTGYGACDHYTMILGTRAQQKGINMHQYVLRNQIVHPYWVNKNNIGFHEYYKNNLSLKEIPDQRQQFDNKMLYYLEKGLDYLLEKNNK
jgi:hypothetical protein